MTLADILAMRFAGNYAADASRFADIHRFATDPANPLADRAAALRHMGEAGMGLDPTSETDAEVVESYLADL